jgi:uncharacterized protein YacL
MKQKNTLIFPAFGLIVGLVIGNFFQNMLLALSLGIGIGFFLAILFKYLGEDSFDE